MSDETNTNTTTDRELGVIEVTSELLKNINDFMWNETTGKGNEDLTEVDCPFPHVTTAKRAFKCCTKLATFKGGSDSSIKTKGFPSLTNASEMLYKTAIAQFTTHEVPMGSVTDASYMLYECPNLSSIHLEMNSVTNADHIVDNCTSLAYVEAYMDLLGTVEDKTLTLPNGVQTAAISLANVKYFSLPSTVTSANISAGAIQDCSQLIPSDSALTTLLLNLPAATTFGGKTLPTSLTNCNLYFSALQNGDNLLKGHTNLTTGKFTIQGLSNLTTANSMFNGFTGMTDWHWNTDLPSLTSANEMFKDCTGLKSITSRMQKLAQANSMFESCTGLQYAYLHLGSYDSKKGYEASALTTGTRMFYNCTSLTGVWSSVKDGDTRKHINLNALTDGTQMFEGCTNEHFTNFYSDLSSLVNGERMFYQTRLEVIGRKGDIHGAVPMNALVNGTHMFSGPDFAAHNYLTDVNINAEGLVDGHYMFAYNPGLTGYDATGATMTFRMDNTTITGKQDVTSVLSNGSSMFRGCGITKFNNSNIDLSGLVYGDSMFMGCTNLTSFECKFYSLLAGMNMFCGCKLDNKSLEYIANHINNLVEGGWVTYNNEGEKEYLRTDEWKYKQWSKTATTIAEGDEGEQSNITEVNIPETSRAVIHVDYDKSSVTDPQILKFEKSLQDKGWKVISCSGANTNLSISEDNKVDTDNKSFVEDIPAWKSQRYEKFNMKITSITSRTNTEGKVEGVMHGSSDVHPESTDSGTES